MRGICSIEIMIGHLGVATESIALFPNRKAGVLFVGIFFALSGYGLMYSMANKNNYLTKFVPNKIRKVLIPAYIVFLVDVILHSMINRNMLYMLNIMFPKTFFLRTNWYVWELLMLYFVFYMSIKMQNNLKKFHLIILFYSIVFICVAYGFEFENPWYGSTLCFWLGIIYFIYRDRFKELFVLRKPMIKIICCSVVMLSSICLFIVRGGGASGLLIARNAASISFVLVVIILLHWFSLGNKVTMWLGECSYEIFLLHPLFIEILRPWIENDMVYALLVIAVTILTAYLYKICERVLKTAL